MMKNQTIDEFLRIRPNIEVFAVQREMAPITSLFWRHSGRNLAREVRQCAIDGSVFTRERRREDEENGGSPEKKKREREAAVSGCSFLVVHSGVSQVAAVRGERRGARLVVVCFYCFLSGWWSLDGKRMEKGEWRRERGRSSIRWSRWLKITGAKGERELQWLGAEIAPWDSRSDHESNGSRMG
ncbi:hypothetical protein HAX54_033156 [Datura stramonium]|uniref:Uncharacterized protein n=1 Tax=Datura stramonium TaxID=4076 RepID=A0ABS8VDF3_DATST|nr:hypothetical protein [Datura stramonium]